MTTIPFSLSHPKKRTKRRKSNSIRNVKNKKKEFKKVTYWVREESAKICLAEMI